MADRSKPACVLAIFLLLMTACGSSAASTSTPAVSASSKVIESNDGACANLVAGAKYRAICGDSAIVDGSDDTVCAEHGGVSTWMVCPQVTAAAVMPTEQATVTAAQVPDTGAAIAATDVISKAYAPVALLYASEAMMEEIANRQQLGTLTGFQQLGTLIAMGVFISGTESLLNEPPPLDELQPAWEKGKTIPPMLKEVVSKWANKEIQPSDVHAELVPVLDQINQMEQLVVPVLASQYGVDASKLQSIRNEMTEQLRQVIDKMGAQETTPTDTSQ
jgi:uncharacterized protein YidB (DUF937 family)